MFQDSDFLALSGLQHFEFCPRQWALIHVEQQWLENRLTVEGKQLHETVDAGRPESRDGYRIERGIGLRSRRLGMTGKADVVEFPLEGEGAPVPVEYKRGRPKSNDCDRIQLCAQAICLEEMLGVTVPEGALFYGEPRRRIRVEFDADLRDRTWLAAMEMHRLFQLGETPAPEYGPKCKSCSLLDICEPERMGSSKLALDWERRLSNLME